MGKGAPKHKKLFIICYGILRTVFRSCYRWQWFGYVVRSGRNFDNTLQGASKNTASSAGAIVES